jgi:hypothetical protein
LTALPVDERGFRVRLREGEYRWLEPRSLAQLTQLWAADRRARSRYRQLSREELLATRSSDTAFVFGSGRSLVDISPGEWAAIARCNTISLREFPRQRWVRADYHLTSEVDSLDEYSARIRGNPLYDETVFVVQGGLRAECGNELIARGLLREGARVFRFARIGRGKAIPPSPDPRRLVHGFNSIFDGTNLAVALGFRRIVLAGADYYNREYFWLPAQIGREYEPSGRAVDRPWGATTAIIELMGRWREHLAVRGVELLVYDRRSLLAERLPVFPRDAVLSS